MENITVETKYLESVGKWSCGIWCPRERHSIWTGGYFHKNKETAIQLAMDALKKSLAFYREFEKPTDKVEMQLSV